MLFLFDFFFFSLLVVGVAILDCEPDYWFDIVFTPFLMHCFCMLVAEYKTIYCHQWNWMHVVGFGRNLMQTWNEHSYRKASESHPGRAVTWRCYQLYWQMKLLRQMSSKCLPGSGVPASEEVEAELETLSCVVWQPISERRCGLIPRRSAISTWSAGWM